MQKRNARLCLILLVLQAVAYWPVLHWYWLRLFDGSDEPWGLVALLTVLFLFWQRETPKVWTISLWPAVFATGYVGAVYYLPPIGRAAFAAFGFVSLITPAYCGRKFHSGLWSLAALSLPIIPSLQFCLGYPLRFMTAWSSALFLKLGGLPVAQEGTILRWNDHAVWVDAPCSGIKMLWMGSYLAAVLVCSGRLDGWRAGALSGLAALLMFAANVTRAGFLFLLEVFVPGYPAWLHGALGVALFFGTACALCGFRKFLGGGKEMKRKTRPVSPKLFFLTAALLCFAGCAPLLSSEKPVLSGVGAAIVNWPSQFRGEKLVELPLSEKEKFFSRDFPGAIKRFRAGQFEITVRYVTQPTRMLHPATDCLKGIGYSITPMPAEIDSEGNHWSCSSAEKAGTRLHVCEIVRDEHGRSWPDAASWYWSTLWHEFSGPFWAYTVAQRTNGRNV